MRTCTSREQSPNAGAGSSGLLAITAPLVNLSIPKEDLEAYFEFLWRYPLSQWREKIKHYVDEHFIIDPIESAGSLSPMPVYTEFHPTGTWEEQKAGMRKFYDKVSEVGLGVTVCCHFFSIYYADKPDKLENSDFREFMSKLVAESLGVDKASAEEIEELEKLLSSKVQAYNGGDKKTDSISLIFSALEELTKFAKNSDHGFSLTHAQDYLARCSPDYLEQLSRASDPAESKKTLLERFSGLLRSSGYRELVREWKRKFNL